MTEVTRTPAAAADIRSSWDLTMATNHQSLAAQPPASSTPPAELFQVKTHIQTATEPLSSGKSTFRPERQVTSGIPEIKPLKPLNHILLSDQMYYTDRGLARCTGLARADMHAGNHNHNQSHSLLLASTSNRSLIATILSCKRISSPWLEPEALFCPR